jgi:ferritin-like metal-binding protein YciE
MQSRKRTLADRGQKLIDSVASKITPSLLYLIINGFHRHGFIWHQVCDVPDMPKISTLEDAYIEQLRDLYSAESQLVKALPKMAKAAHSDELKNGFLEHLEQTKGHVSRLEEIFEGLDEKPTGKKCQAMAGLVEEGSETISEDATPAVKDALLIAAAQRVEHYEIAAYGTVKTFAQTLGHDDAAKLLDETLQEEVETDEKLTEAAQTINAEANEGGEKDEDEDEEKTTSSRRK